MHGPVAHESVGQRDEDPLQETVASHQGLCGKAGLRAIEEAAWTAGPVAVDVTATAKKPGAYWRHACPTASHRHRDRRRRARRHVLHAGTESKTVKNRVHVDLTSSAQDRDQEIERLVALGAQRVGRGQAGG
jgi:hypothetical protein